MEVRRRDVRSQRRSVRKSRPRRDRDPQLPLAARPRRGRAKYDDLEKRLAASPSSLCRLSRWKAMPTARRTRASAPTPRSSPANTNTASIKGGIGHNLPQEAPQAFAASRRQTSVRLETSVRSRRNTIGRIQMPAGHPEKVFFLPSKRRRSYGDHLHRVVRNRTVRNRDYSPRLGPRHNKRMPAQMRRRRSMASPFPKDIDSGN